MREGVRVQTLEELDLMAKDKRAVFCPDSRIVSMRKPRPAAVVLSMQGRYILNLMRSGMYLYERKKKDE